MKNNLAAFLSLLLFVCQHVLSQGNEHGVPVIRTFTPSDLGGHHQTYHGIHASDGYLYFANGNGILIYNGEDWNLIKGRGIQTLLEAKDGTIYAAGASSFGYLKRSESGDLRFETLLTKLDSSKHQFDVSHFLYESDEKIFLIARFGILTYDQDTIISSYDKDTYFRVSANKGEDGLIFQEARSREILQISDGQIGALQDSLLAKEIEQASIFRRFDKKWLMASRRRWFYVLNEDRTSGPVGISDQLFEKEMWGIDSLDKDLAVVRSYRDGMYFLDGEGNFINKITRKDGLADNLVFYSFKDRQGNIWACTDNGISRIENYGYLEYFKTRGSNGAAVLSIERLNNTLFTGKGQSVQKLLKKEESWEFDDPMLTVYALQLIRIDGVNYTTSQRGFGKLTDKFERLDRETVRCVHRSRTDPSLFFFGSPKGVFSRKKSGENWGEPNWIEGITAHVQSITEDDEGNLWTGTLTSGVFKIQSPMVNAVVTQVNFDSEIEISEYADVHYFRGEILVVFNGGILYVNKASGLIEPYCDFGDLFCNSQVGAYSLDFNANRNEIIVSSSEKIIKVGLEGAPTVDTISYAILNQKDYHYAAYLEDDGTTWLGGPAGLVRVDPDARRTTPGFFTKLQSITFGEDSTVHVTEKNELVFTEEVQDLRLNAAALFFESSDHNQYQFWLEGYDREWSDWTMESFKDYTNLKGGNYTFHVRSKNIYGQQGSQVSKSFAIEKDVFETLLFKLLIVLTGLFLLYYALKYASTRRKLKALEVQQNLEMAVTREREAGFKAVLTATENERKRIAKDLHDGVVQQLAAIKVNLSIVELAVTTEAEKAAVQKALKISEQAAIETRGLSHQMMPKALIELGLVPAMEDVINNMFSINEINADFQHFNLRNRYENQIEISVYRIFQELVNNISKHARAKKVDVQLIENDGNLILIVEDDGIGMDKDLTGGIGISNISSRLVTVDGKLDFSSGPNSGTIATVVIPLQG
ncbi:MAG: triple tyrosine motif-containing protein [Cytophagales bacterium]|nr:triple tyrosine motif-containing protein [Cytophagales bacterium]